MCDTFRSQWLFIVLVTELKHYLVYMHACVEGVSGNARNTTHAKLPDSSTRTYFIACYKKWRYENLTK